jgi:hypothetical protein
MSIRYGGNGPRAGILRRRAYLAALTRIRARVLTTREPYPQYNRIREKGPYRRQR